MPNHRIPRVAGAALATLLAGIGGSLASASAQKPRSSAPITLQASSFATSPPVRDLVAGGGGAAAGAQAPPRTNPLAGRLGARRGGTVRSAGAPSDPLAAASRGATGRTPAPNLVFNGTQNPFACDGCSPPDTNGDVGPDNYVQIVNATKVAIFSKSGALLTPAFDLGDLWPASDDCHDNLGDPVALYDPVADRWLLSQFTFSNQICFAISQTGNPQGAYNLYAFETPQFPDYFKVGAWPTGYYVSTNENTYAAYAFDRTKMLAGDPTATGVRFAGQTNFMLPADVDGNPPPPAQGGLFYTFKDRVFHGGGPDRIELFRLTPDFTTPSNSTFELINSFPVAPFRYTVCGFFVFPCITQPGTPQRVDAVSEWPMHRFPYRSFPDHEALVGNFTVGGGSGSPGAGIRWFELRNTGSGWTLFQEGTEDPGDGQNRFMGSIAMDQSGNIALGYSVSSKTLFPSIRYATRSPSDPPGTLQAEQTLVAGLGSQTDSDRWGDYSAMAIDPATGCDFWYTNEYYHPSSASNWKSAIGTFEVPGCGLRPAPVPGPGPVTPPSNSFHIGGVIRNAFGGTAKLLVDVPGPGELTLRGKGVKSRPPEARLAQRPSAKAVSGAGTVTLLVKPKGTKKRKLNRKGKVNVRLTVTFTPTGGTEASQSKKVKLKKRRR
jgi:hypothetical protein